MRPEPSRGRDSRRTSNSPSSRRNTQHPRRRKVRKRSNEVAKRRRKRKFNEAMGGFIPVFLAIVLIIAVVGIFYGAKLVERYRYSSKYADLSEYFGVYYPYQVAMIINNERVEEKAVYYKDSYYLSEDDVRKYFTKHFYVNIDEQNCFYTTQDEIIRADLNQSENFCYMRGDSRNELSCAPVITNDGKTYFSFEYLKLFADFNMAVFNDPQHLVIYTEDKSLDKAKVIKDTQVRYRGGVKSDILKDVKENDTLYVLEEMEDWAKVQTMDGFIGYVEMKRYEKAGSDSITIEKCPITLNYSYLTVDGKVNMAFHQLFSESASDYSDVPKEVGINVVAPTVFRVTDNEGTIANIANTNYVANAHSAGVKVWGVWTDVDDDVDISEILASYEKRQAFIANMISLSQQTGMDGINLDFEKIPSSAGEHWGEFLKELSVETHKAGLVLSVDDYAPTASTVHYKRDIQGLVCDYVIVMGYDEHWASGGVAGSVASIGFVESGIENTIAAGVPAERVINAIPFYTRVWKTKDGSVTADTMSIASTAKWIADCGVELNWNDEAGQYYGEKEMNSILYQVWMEDEESISDKLTVMDTLGCAGVAEWKLGMDTPEIWAVILEYLNS
ncbi:MAG: hypothetical protein J5840_01805 [Lachnospiraceae bacterium]|nr:hypothetical protein [Lachnospiraceae bacterium]